MFSYLIDLYHRATHNRKLSTKERAALKAIEGAIIGFIASLVPQLVSVYIAHGTFNITAQAINTLLVAFFLALFKLWAAQSDAHVGDILDAIAQQLEQQALAQMTTQKINGQTQIPAVHLIIPVTRPIAESLHVPVASAPISDVQGQLPHKPQFVPLPVPLIKDQVLARHDEQSQASAPASDAGAY